MVRGWKRGVVLLGCMAGLQSARAQQFVLPQTLAVSNRDRIFPVSTSSAKRARWWPGSGMLPPPGTTRPASRCPSGPPSTSALPRTSSPSWGAPTPAEFTRTASFQPIPSALGVAFGKEVLEWHGMRLGLGIYNEASWDSSVRLESNPRPDTRVSYVMKSLFRSLAFSAGAGGGSTPATASAPRYSSTTPRPVTSGRPRGTSRTEPRSRR